VRAVATALVAFSVAFAQAQGGWSASPVITLERTRYSVAAAAPGCEEELVVERAVRLVADAVSAVATLRPGGETSGTAHARIVRRLGDLTLRFGSPMVLQRHANCATVCAAIPLAARSVGAVRAFYATRPGEPFREVKLGVWGDYLRWDPDIDTTLVTTDARWVCLQVRNWLAGYDREVFFLVRYER
jgi:hypothetical protein